MITSKIKSLSNAWPVILGLALFLSAAAAPPRLQVVAPASSNEILLALDTAKSTVHWTVGTTLHTVHGAFAFASGKVHFDAVTGKAGGEVVVSSASGDSGNASRDARMHREILQSPKYPEMIFRPAQIDGAVNLSGHSRVNMLGSFSIHGKDHDLTVPVEADVTGNTWKATGKFEVPYVKWGIKDPSNFLLKVKPEVNVELEMSGELSAAK